MKTMGTIDSFPLDQVPLVVGLVQPLIEQCRIILLSGSMGAGKTTFVTELVKKLGSSDEVSSPTYSYMNRYQLSSGRVIYHFDLYRLASAHSFAELGFGEYLADPFALAIVEWPELIQEAYPHALHMTLSYSDETARSLHYFTEINT